MISFQHQVCDPLGLHARVIGKLVKQAKGYECEVSVSGPGGCADAKQLMALMHMGAAQGDILMFTCQGPDEEAAASNIQTFLKEHL